MLEEIQKSATILSRRGPLVIAILACINRSIAAYLLLPAQQWALFAQDCEAAVSLGRHSSNTLSTLACLCPQTVHSLYRLNTQKLLSSDEHRLLNGSQDFGIANRQ